jgi:hypothetical protein
MAAMRLAIFDLDPTNSLIDRAATPSRPGEQT